MRKTAKNPWLIVIVAGILVTAAGWSLWSFLFIGKSAWTAALTPINFVVDGQTHVARPVSRADGSVVVQIVNAADNRMLAESSRSMNPAMRLVIIESHGQVWIHSGDVGTFVFARDESGWKETPWIPGTTASKQFRIPASLYSRMSKSDQDDSAPFREK